MSTTPIAPLPGTPSTRRSTRRWTRRSTRRSRSFTSNPGPPGPKKSSEWIWTGTTSTPNKSSLTDNHQIRKWIFFFLPETITFELFNMIYILRFNSDKIERCNCVCYILSVTEHLLFFPSGSTQWWSSLIARPEILSMVHGYWLHPINLYKWRVAISDLWGNQPLCEILQSFDRCWIDMKKQHMCVDGLCISSVPNLIHLVCTRRTNSCTPPLYVVPPFCNRS